jgi:hypothetical protein
VCALHTHTFTNTYTLQAMEGEANGEEDAQVNQLPVQTHGTVYERLGRLATTCAGLAVLTRAAAVYVKLRENSAVTASATKYLETNRPIRWGADTMPFVNTAIDDLLDTVNRTAPDDSHLPSTGPRAVIMTLVSILWQSNLAPEKVLTFMDNLVAAVIDRAGVLKCNCPLTQASFSSPEGYHEEANTSDCRASRRRGNDDGSPA